MPYYFKLPKFTELTIAQQAAVNEKGALSISGGPGTGKSVISLWRHIRNYSAETKESLLLTYTRSLEKYFVEAIKSEADHAQNEEDKLKLLKAANNVNRTYWWLFHQPVPRKEIIIDEAQDVEQNNYEIINELSNSISYTCDDEQILFPDHLTTESKLKEIFPSNKQYLFDENFRNTFEILHFAKALFNKKLIYQYILETQLEKNRQGPKPTLIITNGNLENQKQYILEILSKYSSDTHNIAILLPNGQAVDDYFNFLQNQDIAVTRYYNGIPNIEIGNIHITTFKSSKGLEFDTVIIPGFDKFGMIDGVITESDYYVAITRTRSNLFLFSPAIPDFLERLDNQKQTYNIEEL